MSDARQQQQTRAGVETGRKVTPAELRQIPMLSAQTDAQLQCLDSGVEIAFTEGETLVTEGERGDDFYFLLSGKLRVVKIIPAGGGEAGVALVDPGATFGELTLLTGLPYTVAIRAVTASRLLRIGEQAFWTLMAACPIVRHNILGDMSYRLQGMQSVTMHQEKMASLGTLAAGLMHELNNPGSAAKRAASQLRQNLLRMHALSEKFASVELTKEQKGCLGELQAHALKLNQPVQMNSLEQSDAEEALVEWMEDAQIADAWRLAPTLVATGIDAGELECARRYFPPDIFSDAMSWLEALSSSMQLVSVIEESIGRVTDLVLAVKSYAYEGKGQKVAVDINHSIHATLVILGHKFREKQIEIEKDFATDLPALESDCSGLNQIWTNLLDNAIDAVSQHGHVKVKTWAERVPDPASQEKNATPKTRTDLFISVTDDGDGIPADVQPHIFDPFYTTKAVGVGTGLGLGIVHRIVAAYQGEVTFTSSAGRTEFLVRLPASSLPAQRAA